MARNEALVTPQRIIWAQERVAMSVDLAAKSAGVTTNKYQCWERGELLPTRNGAFISSSAEIQRIVRDILQKHPTLVTGSRKSNNADQFVIALAKSKKCTLVPDETWAGVGQPVKIPNACQSHGVRLINFVDFLREMKISV